MDQRPDPPGGPRLITLLDEPGLYTTPLVAYRNDITGWVVYGYRDADEMGRPVALGPPRKTEAEALVAALEARAGRQE